MELNSEEGKKTGTLMVDINVVEEEDETFVISFGENRMADAYSNQEQLKPVAAQAHVYASE